MPRGKRSISRKGCLSCKKLKIKCNEAKPSCEYCVHTDRQCIYPDQINGKSTKLILSKRSKSPEKQNSNSELVHTPNYSTELLATNNSPAESYEASIGGEIDDFGSTNYEEIFARHVPVPQSFNSMARQLQMTRFELRLLRFFHDQCIPYVTFNANKKAQHIWRQVFPKYFASSNLVRQATYAMACLNLWPVANLRGLLQADNSECQFQIEPLSVDIPNPFAHVFDSLDVFENRGESIFSITTSYFISSLQSSHQFVGDKSQNSKKLTYDDLAEIYFSGFLIFAYVGVHPHCVLPLIDHDSEYPSDFIGFFPSMRKVFLQAGPAMLGHIIETLMEYDFLTPTENSEKIGFVEVLRIQLSEYHFANIAFAEIGSTICAENQTLTRCLFTLERCYLASIREGHPTPFFKFLALLEEDFIALARNKDMFALRILFTFSCICLYCQFYLSFHENVWAQYIDYFVNEYKGKLCPSDQALYDYVVTQNQFADPNRFSHEMRSLNRMSFKFGGIDLVEKTEVS